MLTRPATGTYPVAAIFNCNIIVRRIAYVTGMGQLEYVEVVSPVSGINSAQDVGRLMSAF